MSERVWFTFPQSYKLKSLKSFFPQKRFWINLNLNE